MVTKSNMKQDKKDCGIRLSKKKTKSTEDE